MDQSDILKYLVNIDKRLQQIESELKLKSNGLDESDNQRNEAIDNNFYNQMKEEIDSRDYNKPLKTRPKVQKASSFSEKSHRKLPSRIKRSFHTIPSDKEEEKRLGSFRRECLSKAIQWNFVDLLDAVSGDFELVLPPWVQSGEAREILWGTDKKMHLRRFLNLLREKGFNVMSSWINNSGIDEAVIKQVWGTYEEFSDYDTVQQKLKCIHCRLVDHVDIKHVGDYFYSADIIDKCLYMKIMETLLPVGAQKDLWNLLLNKCSEVLYKKVVFGAFTIALSHSLGTVEADTDCYREYQVLLDQVSQSDDIQLILTCQCTEICSRSLHPMSCLESMSLTRVYFSPPTVRKLENHSSSSDCAPATSPSSSSSIEDTPPKVLTGELSVEADGVRYNRGRQEDPAFERRIKTRSITQKLKARNRAKDLSIGKSAKNVEDPSGSGSTVLSNSYTKAESQTVIHAKYLLYGSGSQIISKKHSQSSSDSSPGSSCDPLNE